jgi:hypothetical protein
MVDFDEKEEGEVVFRSGSGRHTVKMTKRPPRDDDDDDSLATVQDLKEQGLSNKEIRQFYETGD